MAEAATVIQLLQFSGLILSQCYNYISSAKNAPKEIQTIILEINSLKGILETLQTLAESLNDGRFALLKSLARLNGASPACSAALVQLDGKLKELMQLSTIRRRLQ